jgi:hypothetical protein
MSYKNIPVANTISLTVANSNWSYVPMTAALLDTTNPQFPRTVVLTSAGLLVTRSGSQCGLPLSTICAAAGANVPALTWGPNFGNPPSNTNAGQPSNILGAGNGAAGFSVAAQAESNALLSYQWQFSNGTNVSGGVFSGTTTNTMTVTNIAAAATNTFVCVVSNPSGNATSLVVGIADITSQPANQNIANNGATYFAINVSTGLTIGYQWYVNTTAITASYSYGYAGWNTNNLTIGNVSNSTGGIDGGHFYCAITDGVHTINSANGILTTH